MGPRGNGAKRKINNFGLNELGAYYLFTTYKCNACLGPWGESDPELIQTTGSQGLIRSKALLTT